LSSGDRQGETARCQELGVAGHLPKPVKQSYLLNLVRTALRGTCSREDEEAPAPDPVRERDRRLRILLAEDNPVNRRLAVLLLKNQGHAVEVAASGKEAIEALDRGPFDLVLMDVQMPEMDGFEATAVIREKEKGTGRHIPILAMTAHAMMGDRESCLEMGMDGYISKPFQEKELRQAIADAVGPG
ncbi:MAG: response regulator, partial [Planctomycetes bacterium]|nr:response regulator [Planctomycetota bacterium]